MKRIDGTPAPAHSKQGQHPLIQAAVETGEALQEPRQPCGGGRWTTATCSEKWHRRRQDPLSTLRIRNLRSIGRLAFRQHLGVEKAAVRRTIDLEIS